MTLDLSGDVAVVTGAAQGIGYAIADELAAHGAPVALADLDLQGAEAAAASIEAAHDVEAMAVECDVTDEPQVAALVETVTDALGPVTGFVNNAGGPEGLAPVWETSVADWRETVTLSLTGTFLGTKHAIGHMLEADVAGTVVNVSSLNHEAPTEGMGHYSAAKAGVSQLTAVAAREAGRHGIRVNAVAPGVVRTPTTEEGRLVSGEMGEAFRERTPLGRIGEPTDVARVVTFLVSEYGNWITGTTVPVDGGLHTNGLHSYYDTYLETLDEW